MSSNERPSWFSAIAPGVLVAATGVGAGDLLTAGIAGSRVGVAVLWAALAGALLKWTLAEGIARWQMATDTTLLEGWISRLGHWIQWVFLGYLVLWSFVVGGALVNACGVAGTALWPVGSPETSKVVWGVAHSFVGLGLVWLGGFKLFEKVMAVCIGVMFVTVMLTAVLIRPDWAAVGRGIVIPTIPPGGLGWILGILGGVGGTVTLLSYGYWVREKGRRGLEGLRACRIDLSIGYVMTALFGMAMVIIGSRVTIDEGTMVAVRMADQLHQAVGGLGRWVFLIGFWGAVFSSLLGVWQGVPYLFADFLALRGGPSAEGPPRVDFVRSRPYRIYLLAIAIVPLGLLRMSVERIQLTYAVFGALFMPLLALTLLIMNNRVRWTGRTFRSGVAINAALVATLLFFLYAGVQALVDGLPLPARGP